MNSKTSKRHKISPKRGRPPNKLKKNVENGGAEIFVIPPHLLKELGINLSSVIDNQGDLSNTKLKDEAVVANEFEVGPLDNVQSHKDSSKSTTQKHTTDCSTILETATLMKQSVFLSPTFHDNSNMTLGNIENVAQHAEYTTFAREDVRENSAFSEIIAYPKDVSNVSQLTLNVAPVVLSGNQYHDYSTHEELHNTLVSTEAVKAIQIQNIYTDVSDKVTRQSSTDDHSDEAYLSDCSNLGSLETCDSVNCIPIENPTSSKLPHENNCKINIISEEILNTVQINELKKLHNTKPSDLFPVSINSVITKDKSNKKDNINIITQDKVTKALPSFENLKKNARNDRKSPEPRSIIDSIIFYDEKGNVLQTYNDFDNQATEDEEINKSDILILNDAHIEITPNNYTAEIQNQEKTCVSENNFGVCIDFAETDIEMHLKENEDTLVKFVNEITSNDNDGILAKIENSEEDSFSKKEEEYIEQDAADNISTIVQELELNSSNINVSNCMDYSLNTECTDNDNNTNEKEIEDENIVCQSELSDSKKSPQNSECSQSSSFKEPETEKSKDKNNEEVSEKGSEHVSDKIKEIATYLRQFAEIRSKSKTMIPQKYVSGNLPIKVPKENSLKAKLCIQGVEKPGGSEELDNKKNPKIIKTYIRAKSSKILPPAAPENIVQLDRSQEELNISNIELDESSIIIASNTLKMQDFCLCDDYGRLEFCESDVPYEHIHFWDHNTTDVGDQELVNDNSEQSDQEKAVSFIMYEHRICWNILLFKKSHEIALKKKAQHSKEFENCNTAQDVNIEHCVSSCSSLTADNSNIQYQYSESMSADQIEKKIAADLQVNPITVENGICDKILKQQTHDDDMITLQQPNMAEKDIEVSNEAIDDHSDTPQLHTVTEEKTSTNKAKKHKKISIEAVTNEKKDSKSPTEKPVELSLSSKIVETKPGKQVSKEDNGLPKNQPKSQPTNSKGMHKDTSSKKSLSSSEIKEDPSKKKSKKRAEKRKKSIAQEEINMGHEGPKTKQNKAEKDIGSTTSKTVECAVCEQKVAEAEWKNHAREKHNYIAWIAGGSLDVEDAELIDNVKIILENKGALLCQICLTEHKRPKSFIKHILKCIKTSTEDKQKTDAIVENTDNVEETRKIVFSDTVKCEICKIDVETNKWLEHSQQNHNYLAWRDGDEPLDLENDEMIRTHLMEVLKQVEDLKCFKCGLTRKYAKAFLKHIQICNEDSSLVNADNSCDITQVDQSISEENNSMDINHVKCGVCHQEVVPNDWLEHIQDKHEYMAWKEGESLDLSNEEEVYNHLYGIAQSMGGLKCLKCNLVRKYVKSYKTHIKSCNLLHEDSISGTEPISVEQRTSKLEPRKVKCAVCSEQVDLEYWNDHKMRNHYNVAWYVGDIPIDYKNPNVIERHVREYRLKNKSMVCSNCGTSRASCMGFYAHVIVCGKSEEEVDRLHRTVCNICNKKYLWVYQNQHMKWHNDQELAKEQKQKRLEMRENELTTPKEDSSDTLPGQRRKAAQKALNVIEKYSNDGFKHVCQVCRYATDCDKDLAKHYCGKTKARDFSDSEDSVKLGLESEGESEDSNVDSDLSDDVEQMLMRKRKRHRDYVSITSKIPRFLSKREHVNGYLTKSGVEFREYHFTSERLFPEWYQTNYEAVPDDQLSKYMPPLAESCKVRISEPNWTTYKRLECNEGKGRNPSIFVGACIQSVSWVPPPLHDENESGQYLTVLCHLESDLPRVLVEPTAPRPGLIQIWDYGKFDIPPKFSIGLSHDLGTAWAADWCPSGTRDTIPETEPTGILRLGLLAVAFSTGCAFIFSVPYPSSVVKTDNLFYKLKPVAELRLTMSSERKRFQATSISWSMQKNHDCIIVGYGDGTIAYFDLNTESPFLKTKDNDVTVFYPYEDERPQNTCITGLGTYPSTSPLSQPGAVCLSSPTGAALLRRGARQTTHSVSSRAIFQPFWPSAALAGEDATSTIVNEVEWLGGGRRLGAAGAAAGCAGCGRVALLAAPLLRVVRPHPVVPHFNRHLIAILQMVPLGNKRKKIANDELQVKVEPITYQDAVNKYGIELRIDKEAISKQSLAAREQFPERFPLAEVPSMAFCPSAEYHKKLAVATHAGIVFLLNV